MGKQRTAAAPPADQPDAATQTDESTQVQPGTMPPVDDETAAAPPADQPDAATPAGPDTPTTPDEPTVDARLDDPPPDPELPVVTPVASSCRHSIMRPGWAGKGKQRLPVYRCDSCGTELPRGEDGRPTIFGGAR